MQKVRGGQAPNFLFSAKPAIQNSNIQPLVFLAKMKDQQSLYFLICCQLMNFWVILPGL